jgi:uncharacterized membrane protein
MDAKLVALVVAGLFLGLIIFMIGFTSALILFEWLYPRAEHPRYGHQGER